MTQAGDQGAQVITDPGYPAAESAVGGRVGNAGGRLLSEQAIDCGRAHGAGAFGRRGDAQRATMHGQPLGVDDQQVMTTEEVVERSQRIIAEVFVVDGVEFGVIKEIAGIGRLAHHYPVVLHQSSESSHETVEVGDVGKDVVGMDDVGAPALTGQAFGDCHPEELVERRDASLLLGDACDVGGWFDAQDGHTQFLVPAQQVAVVAGDFDHQALRSQATPARHPLGDGAGVIQETVGKRGSVEVVAKQDVGLDRLGDLQQRAARTEDKHEREGRFVQRCSRIEQRIGEGGPAEVNDRR